ncbi:MAG TPA: PAS domain-containing sensor histidine kinase [Anaeromyxobacter sp.]|nr:PAS domain-containing sensor histidine kinase [Anaeromyxobacter sp.]
MTVQHAFEPRPPAYADTGELLLALGPQARRARLSRKLRQWSWGAIPALFVALHAVNAARVPGTYGSSALVLGLNLLFLVWVSILVSVLVTRSFLERGELGLLLLAGGTAILALSVVASGTIGGGDPNLAITIYNLGVLFTAAAHALVATSLRWAARVVARRRRAVVWTAVVALFLVAVISVLAWEGALPTFFVNGRGGTPIRQVVLGSAIAGFGVAAAGLSRGSSRSPFRHWYALGMGLLALGLYGVLIQGTFSSVVGWLGRGTQYLGALALLAAAISSVRENQSWALPLGALLRQTEERYRILFENMSEGFLLGEAGPVEADRTYRLVDMNPAAEHLLGLTRAPALGQRLRDLVPPSASDVVERCRAVVETGAPARFAITSRDGHRHLAVTAFAPEPNRLALLFSDDSERHRAERALSDAHARLEEVDRNKSRFLAVLSHELRNPLAPIRNSVYILGRSDAASEQSRRAKEILARQVDHLAKLVDELLDVTRISSGRIELHRTDLDLAALVRSAVEDRRASIEERGLELRVDVPAGPVPANGDPTRLSQVVGNLLQNAAKFTPAGGAVTLTLTVTGDAAELCVRDTGVGIAPELLTGIFEPFTQGPQTLARSEGGLGLGLSLVKALVELHGGAVEARSAGPGTGAEVIVRLPRSPAPA